MIVHKCDICGCEIPIVKKKIFGIETEVLDRGKIRCKELNCSKLFERVDICKSCAEVLSSKLDYELLKIRLQ